MQNYFVAFKSYRLVVKEQNQSISLQKTKNEILALTGNFFTKSLLQSHFFHFAFCICVLLMPFQSYSQLYGYWKFNEGAGTTTSDFSKNNLTGTLQGSSPPGWSIDGGRTGAVGDHALIFGETNAFSRVQVPIPIDVSAITDKFTFAFWVYETGNSNYGHIFVTTNDGANRSWLWQTENLVGGDQAYIWSTVNAAWQKPLGYTNPNNVWKHYTVTYDASLGSNQLKRYVDGVLAAEYTVTGSPNFPVFNTLYLGGWTALNSGIIGKLDDMVIFRSVEDPVAIMNGTHQELVNLISTNEALDISAASATLGGSIISNGEINISERGIVWSTSASPTTSDNKVAIGAGEGSFAQTISVVQGQTIYVRAYSINEFGTGYGNQITFTTPSNTASAPRLYTESASLALRADNDFAVFLGDDNNVTSLFYQNNVDWPTQISAAATLDLVKSLNDTYIYVVALGGGGTEDFGGRINGQDITTITGSQRAISRLSAPSVTQDGYLLIDEFLSGKTNESVTNGTYNVQLADLQSALDGAVWGSAVSTGAGSGIPPNHKTTGVSAELTGRAWGFPSETTVVFRYPSSTIFSPIEDLTNQPSYESVKIFFKVPSNTGGSPITGYVVQYRLAGSSTVWTTGVSSVCPGGNQPCLDVTGLESGVNYEFRIAATNANGTGLYSSVFELTTLETHVWQGLINDLGDISGNWDNGLPPADAKIKIPASAPVMPVFQSSYRAGNIEIENGASLSLAPGTALTFAPGKGASGNGKIILKSDANGDGSIGRLHSTNFVDVPVVQERFVAGNHRAFRFFSHPYTTAVPLSVVANVIDITGSGGSANGFTDTDTNNPSAFRFSPISSNGSGTGEDAGWIPFTTTSETIARWEAIRILFRGSKGQANSLLDGAYTPDPVTIEWEGTINQGAQIIPLVGQLRIAGPPAVYSDWNLVGNPFPSAIDLTGATHSISNGLDYAVWRPRVGNGPALNLVPGAGRGGLYVQEPLSTGSIIIPSGGGFFIRAGGTSATLTIPEPAKTTATTAQITNVLRQSNEGSKYGANTLQIQLSDGEEYLDRVLLFLNAANKAGLELEDAPKMANPAINFFTVSNDNWALAIDRRAYSSKEGENRIPLHILAPNFKYTLSLPDFDMEEGISLRLYDRFKDEYINLNQNTSYNFEVTADPKSKGHRFDLVMGVEVITSLETVSNRFQAFILPNPAQEQVRISIQKPDNLADTNIRLVSMTGVVLRNEKLLADSTDLDINLTELSKGIYLVEITHGTERIVKRLIVK
jgi:hypothetical protein